MELLTAQKSEESPINSGSFVEEPSGLDPIVRRRLIRLVLAGSLLFLGCALAKVFFVSILIALYFLVLFLGKRLDPVDVLVIVLAVEPLLGPYRVYGSFHLDRVLVLLALASLWSAKGPHYRRFVSNKLDLALCFFLAACGLAATFSFMHREPFRILLDSLVIPFGYYLVAKNCAQRQDLLPKLYIAAVIAVLGFGTFGLIEAATKVDFLSFGELPMDPFRISGPFRRAEDFGICMTLLVLFCFAMKSIRQESRVSPLVLRSIPPLAIVSCYFTLTRGIWLGFAAGWLVQAARRNLRAVLLLIPPLILGAWLFFELILPQISGDVWEHRVNNDRTINARIATYKSAFAMFVDHPVFGVGFAAFNETWERYPELYQKFHNEEPSVASPHNIFMCLLSETGAIGVIAFVFFLVRAFQNASRVGSYAQTSVQREYAGFMVSALVAYLAAGMGLHIIRNTDFISKYLFIFLGISSGMVDCVGLFPRRPRRRLAKTALGVNLSGQNPGEVGG
jgi:hypothetical protein